MARDPPPLAPGEGDHRWKRCARNAAYLALATGGVGLAGVAVGTVFGVQAKATYDDAQAGSLCEKSACSSSQGDQMITRARRYGNGSTAAFLVGAAGLVAGAALWLTAAPNTPQLGVGMGTLEVRGTW
jgi:hypothetical protein